VTLSRAAAWRAAIVLAVTGAWLAGLLVSLHELNRPLKVGERLMIDGPGVLDHGVCCREPATHFLARLFLEFVPLTALVCVAGLALAFPLINRLARK